MKETLTSAINKIGEFHINLKYIIAFIIILLIVLYFCKEQELFDRLLMLLVPFLIGTSVKVSMITLGLLG